MLAYYTQKNFHKLALLLILRELIGIYTVKTLTQSSTNHGDVGWRNALC